MSYLESIILGIIQGLTEFIPISSTGHLILVREFFGMGQTNGLAIDAYLQLATVLAVLVYFWSDLISILKSAIRLTLRKTIDVKEKILLLAIVSGTIPALILGLLIEDKMEGVFRQASVVAFGLLVGSALMIFAEKANKYKSSDNDLTIGKGFLIGIFQALALIPGMSRSGSTISGALIMGLSRVEAARFSFLLSFPIISGSGLLKLNELTSSGIFQMSAGPLILGFISAFIFGIGAIHFLIKYLSRNSLMIFVWYRLILAGIIVILLI